MRKPDRIADIIVITLVALVLFFIITSLFFTRVTNTSLVHSEGYIQDPDPDSAFIYTLSTSLPYHTYVRLKDSARNADNYIRHITEGIAEGYSAAGIGVYTIRDCISCKDRWGRANDSGYADTTRYLGISSYYFKKELESPIGTKPVFFRKEGRNYIKYEDTIRIAGNLHLRPLIKEVPFRYDAHGQIVKFKVSTIVYCISWILMIVYAILQSGGLLWSVICLIRLCLSIARGAFFTEENKMRLAFCAWYMFLSALIPLLINPPVRLWYYHITKIWFSINLSDCIEPTWFIAAIIFWLLFRAFNKGLQLQQEHDLTV
ncbi:hypothetical protein HNQ91_000056 [Filimonas zeae]|uniref:DUF2975 domain-containing protein n=1 Tax=Filimonas zeae TaxID=1737353 RepID=A0A917IJV5_9BACT|nr:DUF2975 domain-containing protein [Filimonas zeae]MDR6337034.1 hypothetical protein [Filimonas zeae]GGH56682.1 hypothetical protein GCM10011379_00550 [Filimonas zeae]